MNNNPYHKEIIGTIILGPLLLILETWRRWDELFSYLYLDDVWLVMLALVAISYLRKKRYIGQLLWLFTCGCAFCMITGSFFFAVSKIGSIDPSGFSTSQVVLVKGFMYALVIVMSIRGVRLLLEHRFED